MTGVPLSRSLRRISGLEGGAAHPTVLTTFFFFLDIIWSFFKQIFSMFYKTVSSLFYRDSILKFLRENTL
jgi:hypothetical protein